MMMHFVLTECENQSLFEDLDSSAPIGGFAKSRKIYYRELVARFGHHMAITWNIGEENGWDQSGALGADATSNTTQQRKDFADWLLSLLYYDDHISIHNGPSSTDAIFAGILGYAGYSGPAIQWNIWNNIHGKVLQWY